MTYQFLRGTLCFQHNEDLVNNRSVMPLDVLGCTRATLMCSMSVSSCLERLGNLTKPYRDGDRLL